MPYQWIDPDLFLEYEGVAVYHCYDDGSTVSTYWYTTDAADCNSDAPLPAAAQFDVRELPALGLDAADLTTHAGIIRHAIEAGLLTGEAARPSDPPLLGEQPPAGMEDSSAQNGKAADEQDPCSPDPSHAPDLETLIEWEADGMCEATDGCVVEPDGTCPHGCPSWLLVLGLI
jgi:hypothetical protein